MMGTWGFPYLKLLDLATYLVYVQRMAPAESSELNKNLAFVEGDTWPGIPLVTFSTPPSENLESIRMAFRQSFVATRTMVKLSSDSGGIVILDPVTWSFKVPHQFLPLAAGSYVWQIETTDAIGRISTPMQGSIQVLSDIVEPNQVVTGVSTEYSSYYPCWSSSAVYVYTAFGQLLNIGTPVYADPNLSLPLAQDFVFQNTQYFVVDGKIDSVALCPFDTYSCSASCAQPNSFDLYIGTGFTFPTGGQVFSDALLTTPRNGSFVYNNNIYDCLNGYASFYEACFSNSWEVRVSCFDSSPIGTLYSYANAQSLAIGVALFSDSATTIPVVDGSYVIDGVTYTTVSGIIDSATPCLVVLTWNGFQDCYGVSLVAYTAGVPLQLGSIIYNDFFCTSPRTSSSFSYQGYTYSTDVNGAIDSVTYCGDSALTVYSDCPLSLPPPISFTLYSTYVYPSAAPGYPSWQLIPFGQVMYEDAALTIPFTGPYGGGGGFVYANVSYSTNGSGQVYQAINNCP